MSQDIKKQQTHQWLPVKKPSPYDGWRTIAPRTHSNIVRDILYKDDNDQLKIGAFDPQLITQACASYKPGQLVKVLSVGLVGIVERHVHEIIYVKINDETYKVSRYDLVKTSRDEVRVQDGLFTEQAELQKKSRGQYANN